MKRGAKIDPKDPQIAEVLCQLKEYFKFLKGYGELVSDLAGYAGCSRQNVYRWLRDQATPKEKSLIKIKEWLSAQKQKESRQRSELDY